eukprot:1139915-Pleurochrysis_carterae.AAC.1
MLTVLGNHRQRRCAAVTTELHGRQRRQRLASSNDGVAAQVATTVTPCWQRQQRSSADGDNCNALLVVKTTALRRRRQRCLCKQRATSVAPVARAYLLGETTSSCFS